jgi:hypothetical protein
LRDERVFDVPFEKETNLSFEIFGGNAKTKAYFENDVPVLELFLDIEVELVEMETKDNKLLQESKTIALSHKQKTFIENAIKNDIKTLLEFESENKIDVTNLYCVFENCDKTKFEKFLRTLDDKDSYIGNILVKTKVNLKFR